MEYLLGSLYVTRCYESLDTMNEHNGVSSLNQSMTDGAEGGLIEQMSSPLDQSDLLDSPGDIFAARRSTAKPSRVDPMTISTPGASALARRHILDGAAEDGEPKKNTATTTTTTATSPGSAGSGRVTPVASNAYASEVVSPRSEPSSSSPCRSSMPVLRNVAPVEYPVPVWELENKYVLLYLAPPTEPSKGVASNGAVRYHGSPDNSTTHLYGEAVTGGGDGAVTDASRRSRQETPISAVSLWKQQQHQQQQPQRSPHTPSLPKTLLTRTQSSPPRQAQSGANTTTATHVNPNVLRPQARATPLALPTEKLLLLFYGLLMKQLHEAETSPLEGAAAGSTGGTMPSPAAARRGTVPEASPPCGANTTRPSITVESMAAAMGGVAARVDAPVAVLELQYVPLAGGTHDDPTLAVDDAQLGVVPTVRAGAHSLPSAANTSSPASSLGATASSATAAGLARGAGPSMTTTVVGLTLPRVHSQTASPDGQGSPLLGPQRGGAPFRPASPVPVTALGSAPSPGSNSSGGGAGRLSTGTSGAGTGSMTVTSTAGPASSFMTQSAAGRLPNNAAMATFSQVHSGGGGLSAAAAAAGTAAKPLSEVVNLVLDGASVDLDRVYFDRAMTEGDFYGGWFALRNGDAYRRVIDIYGLTSWPTVLLLDPSGNVVSFHALEHIEKELRHHYYARYMRRRTKPPPPLMLTTPSEAASRLATEGSPHCAQAPFTTGTQAQGETSMSLTELSSPLSVEDETPPVASLRTEAHDEFRSRDMTSTTRSSDKTTDGDNNEDELTDQGTNLSSTASPIPGQTERSGRDREASGAAAPSLASPLSPGVTSDSTVAPHGALASPCTTPAGLTNATRALSSPLEPGDAQTTSSSSAPLPASQVELADSASFTSGTLLPSSAAQSPSAAAIASASSAAAAVDAVEVPDLRSSPRATANFTPPTTHAKEAEDTRKSNKAPMDRSPLTADDDEVAPLPSGHASSKTESLPPPALRTESRMSAESWVTGVMSVPSTQFLETSTSTDTSGMAVLTLAPGGVELLARTGQTAAPVSIPAHLRAQVAAAAGVGLPETDRQASVAFCSAFPWCPTRVMGAASGSDAEGGEGVTCSSCSEDAHDLCGATGNKDAAHGDDTSGPARPSLQPLLLRALSLAKPAASIANAIAPVDVMEGAAGADGAVSGVEAEHLILVFGAHWHPAVSRVLKAVARLTTSVNGPSQPDGDAINMASEELDGEGLFAGGRGFFMSGGGGGQGGLSGFGGSLEELDGNGGIGLPSTLSGTFPTLNGEHEGMLGQGSAGHVTDEEEEAGGRDGHDATAAARHAHVLYVCADDTFEELQASVREVPGWWSCLSPALMSPADEKPTPEDASSSISQSKVFSESSVTVSSQPLGGASGSPTHPVRRLNYGGSSSATKQSWATMPAADVVTWLTSSFDVTAMPRVVVLKRFPPCTGADSGDAPVGCHAHAAVSAITWRPVQLHAEAVRLFSDPKGEQFPWPEPNIMYSGADGEVELGEANETRVSSCSPGEVASLQSTLRTFPRVTSLASATATGVEPSVSRLMNWYCGDAPLAATYSGGQVSITTRATAGSASCGVGTAESCGEDVKVGPLSRTTRAPVPHPVRTALGEMCDGAQDAAQSVLDSAAANATRYVMPPLAPFTLQTTQVLNPAAQESQEKTSKVSTGDGVLGDAPMYPTEEAAGTSLEATVVQVPSELPVRLRRGGFFLVLCAFGPVDANLHQDCLTALREARLWLADVLSERKQKAWEAAQRSRDQLTLTLPLRVGGGDNAVGGTLSGADLSQSSPRGGSSWLQTHANFTAIPGLAAFSSNEEHRMGTSPPAFASVMSDRSLNSTYVFNDVQRALRQHAPAEYDGERGVASSGTTLPLVYFYDAVYPNPRANAARAMGVPMSCNRTPEVLNDHTRAAREEHSEDLACLQEQVLSTILEQDETLLPPREGEIFLACVRLPQKLSAVLRRRLPSELPPTATATTTTTTVTATQASAPSVSPAATSAPSPSPPANASSATIGPDKASRPTATSSTPSAGRTGSQAAITTSVVATSGANSSATNPNRRASLSLEGTEMGVDGGHSGSPSLATTLRKDPSPDPDLHPVASVVMVKQFIYEHILEGLQEM